MREELLELQAIGYAAMGHRDGCSRVSLLATVGNHDDDFILSVTLEYQGIRLYQKHLESTFDLRSR